LPKSKLIENTSWLPIDNSTIYNCDIKTMSSKTFAILCYLLAESKTDNYCRVTLGEIQEYFGYNNLPTLKNQIFKLITLNYITLEDDINIKKIKKYNKILINLIYKDKVQKGKLSGKVAFEMIPLDIFYKKYKYINHYGWALLCALSVYYNGEWGYSCPTIDNLCNILGMSSRYVQKAIKILCKYNLIKLLDKNDKVLAFINTNKETYYRFEVNKYIIKYMNSKIWFNYLLKLGRRKEEQRNEIEEKEIDDEENDSMQISETLITEEWC